MKLDGASDLYRQEELPHFSAADSVRAPRLLSIQPARIIRDDIGRAAWVITADNRWFGLKYETGNPRHVVELIEPFIVWRGDGNTYRAFHLNRTAPIFTSSGSQMSFTGEVTVNQMTGKVNVLMF